MTARFQYVDYNRSHASAEIIFRMLMLRQRVILKTLQEGPRRVAC